MAIQYCSSLFFSFTFSTSHLFKIYRVYEFTSILYFNKMPKTLKQIQAINSTRKSVHGQQ